MNYFDIRKNFRWLILAENAESSIDWEALDDRISTMEYIAEKLWRNDRKGYIDWILSDEMTGERKKYQKERLENEQKEFEELKDKTAYYIYQTKDTQKQKELFEALKAKKKHIDSLTGGISQDMIERARLYPIERMLEIRNGMAKCIAHDDSRPSMNCKNNYVYCHTCGYTGDAIDVYMRKNNVSFKEAVTSMI